MKRLLAVAVGFTLILVAAAAANALVSKRYNFEKDLTLEMGVASPNGLRLDSVSFKVPATNEDRLTRTGGLLTARVAVSNTTDGAGLVLTSQSEAAGAGPVILTLKETAEVDGPVVALAEVASIAGSRGRASTITRG